MINDGHTFSLSARLWQERGWIPISKVGKWDIDIFFCKVPRTLICRAFDWLLMEFSKTSVGRRKVVALPKQKFNVSHDYGNAVFARAFHGHLRAQKFADYNVWFGTSKSCFSTHYKFDTSSIRELVSLDFKIGLLWYGDDLFMPEDGTTQRRTRKPHS